MGTVAVLVAATRVTSQLNLRKRFTRSKTARFAEDLPTRKVLDSAEAAVVDIVPKISALQQQAAALREGELREVMEGLELLKRQELWGVFGEVDELLSALVDAIHSLRESALSCQRCELREHVEQLDREVQQWVGRLHQDEEDPLALDHPSIQVETVIEPHLIGLCQRNAPEEVKRALRVAESDWNRWSRELVRSAQEHDSRLILEAAVLSTPDRFELYFSSPETRREEAMQLALAFLVHQTGLSDEALTPFLFCLSGDFATRHLFEVASGLDSPVMGETQSLAQVKACYEESIKKTAEGGLPGCGGTAISKMLNAAVRTGKIARTQTGISKGAVSISSAAVEVMATSAEGDLQKSVSGLKICIVGADQMARLVLINLVTKHPDLNIVVLDEEPEKVKELFNAASGCSPVAIGIASGRIQSSQWESLLSHLVSCDVLYATATKGRAYITVAMIRALERGPMMIFDMTEPSSVEWQCGELPRVSLHCLLSLREVVRDNARKRQDQAALARHLVQEQAHTFKVWLCSQGAVPYLAALQARAEEIRMSEISKLARSLRDVEEHEHEAIDILTKAIISRLLQPVIESIKEETDGHEKRLRIRAMKDVWALEPLHDRKPKLQGSQRPALGFSPPPEP